MVSCNWIEFGSIPMHGDRQIVKACRLKGSRGKQLVTPDGWTWDNSLSASFGFARTGDKSFEVSEKEDGVDEVRTPLARKPWFMGRPFRK